MQPETLLDRFCYSLKQLGPIKPMSMDETRTNFTELAAVRQDLIMEDKSSKRYRDLQLEERRLIDRIVTSCLPYSLRLAKDYARGHDNPDLLMDLIAEGNMGLCRAVEKYDPKTNVPFRMYAAFWMKAGFMVCLKAHRKLVKSNKGDVVTVYIERPLPDTGAEEHAETYMLRNAAKSQVEEAMKDMNPVEQVILRLRTGVLGYNATPYTSLARIFGCRGTAYCKAVYQRSLGKIQAALLSGSTTSETSCELSPEQA